MIWPFASKREESLGVDIGTSSIKVVELKKKKEGFELSNYARLEIGESENLSGRGRTSSLRMLDTQVAGVLKEIFKKADIESRRATFGIPVFSSFITVVDFPVMPEKELASAVGFEARQYIPIPLSEVMLDWMPLGRMQNKIFSSGRGAGAATTLPDASVGTGRSGQAEKTQVLLVAVPKEVINKYMRIADLARLELAGLEVETLALARSLVGGAKEPVAVADVGAMSTTINIIDEGMARVVHHLDTSGNEFTKIIAQGMNLSRERSARLKSEQGLRAMVENMSRGNSLGGGEAGIGRLLSPVADIIINELDRSISLYTRRWGKKVGKIILSGGSARMPGLADYIKSRLNLETSIGNPWSGVEAPEALKGMLEEMGPSMAVATGLAKRES